MKVFEWTTDEKPSLYSVVDTNGRVIVTRIIGIYPRVEPWTLVSYAERFR